MKRLFYLLCTPICLALISCDTDYSSYPPQFSDMVFETEAAVQTDTVTAGQTFHATLSMGTGQQNVYFSSAPDWAIDKDVKPTTSTTTGGGMLPSATFIVPTDMTEGWHNVSVGLAYGITGNESKEMKNYTTASGLKVEYTQPWAGAIGHYIFTCTKKIYVKAAQQQPEENSAETKS